MGKDVIAIAPDGTPCAYQLKGSPDRQISLSQWDRDNLGAQISKLANQAISHPSVPDRPHRSFLVTNREVSEEVCRAIDDLRRSWRQNGMPDREFQTITRGQLLTWAQELGRDLWPSELGDAKGLLELFLLPGTGLLPDAQFARLLEQTLALNDDSLSQPDSCRRLASAALLTSIATTPFVEKQNHVAEVHAWGLYLGYLCATVEKRALSASDYAAELELAVDAIAACLEALAAEVVTRSAQGHMELTEGDSAIDFAHLFYRARVTMLVGYLSALALSCMEHLGEVQVAGVPCTGFASWLADFIRRNWRFVWLWGEGATPHLLAAYWFLHAFGRPGEARDVLASTIRGVLQASHGERSMGLPSVYDTPEEAMEQRLGLPSGGPPASLRRQSHVLEGLLHLFVRLNYKQAAKVRWPEFTRFTLRSYRPSEPWRFFLWRDSETGECSDVLPPRQQKWEALRTAALDSDGTCIPPVLRARPELVLLLAQVYPHRLGSPVMRWLDTAFSEQRRRCRGLA